MNTSTRENIEQSEKIICEYLSELDSTEVRRSSELEFEIAKQIQDKLSEEIVDAVHIGNSYDSIGDIKIITKTGLKYCELKMLSSKSSSGTRFNIREESLHDSQVFMDETVLTWKEYMEQYNQEETVLSLLDSYRYYPENIHDSYNTKIQKKETLGRYIRNLINNTVGSISEAIQSTDPALKQAGKIKQAIMTFDKKMKKKYLTYLSNKQLNSDRLKAFSLVVTGGYHVKEHIMEYVDVVDRVKKEVNGVGNVFDDYKVFYAYLDPDLEDVAVDQGEQERTIEKLSNKENWTLSIKYDKSEIENTSYKVGYIEDNEFHSVFRLALNWKNVFQGVRNPAVNGFEGEFFKE